MRGCGALQATRDAAMQHAAAAKTAIAALPASDWKEAMETLASYSVSRRY